MNPCYNLPLRSLRFNGSVLEVEQASTSGGMAGRTGVAIWNSCLLLSRFVSSLPSSSSQLLGLFEGKDVLELGCGTGLASLVAAPLAKSVLATDGNTEVAGLAAKNVAKNANMRPSDNIQVLQMKWGTMEVPPDLYSSVDTVFGR